MRAPMSEHRSSIDIDAAPETVYQFLVTEQGLTTWMGPVGIAESRARWSI